MKVGRVVDSVENGKDSTTGITEDLLDIMTKHHFMEYLTPRQTDERVIEVNIGLHASRYKCSTVLVRGLLEAWRGRRSPGFSDKLFSSKDRTDMCNVDSQRGSTIAKNESGGQ